MPLQVGSEIDGRYRIIGGIGEGGMGQVLEVEHLALKRRFALKLLRLERHNLELVRRFEREARALARIDSPRVAQVVDSGYADAVGPYYVMELVRGETLQARVMRRGALPFSEAVTIGIELAEALADVHEQSIIHRDLKPSNVGLLPKGPVPVKLLDFGLAASIDDLYLERITQSQQVLGSLPYMAPERFHGTRTSYAVDLYSLGVVLYESLSGKLPYSAPSTAALIHQILTGSVPRLEVKNVASEPVERIIRKLLAKAPDDRFGSAREVATALRASLVELGVDPLVMTSSLTDVFRTNPSTSVPSDLPHAETVSSDRALPRASALAGAPTKRRWPFRAGAALIGAGAMAIAAAGWLLAGPNAEPVGSEQDIATVDPEPAPGAAARATDESSEPTTHDDGEPTLKARGIGEAGASAASGALEGTEASTVGSAAAERSAPVPAVSPRLASSGTATSGTATSGTATSGTATSGTASSGTDAAHVGARPADSRGDETSLGERASRTRERRATRPTRPRASGARSPAGDAPPKPSGSEDDDATGSTPSPWRGEIISERQ